MIALNWQMLLPIFTVEDLIAIYFVVDVTTFVAISLYCKMADVFAIICGRWKTTKCLYVMLADVIAMVVDGITTQGGFYLADVIAMVTDGITTGQLYFNFSSEMFNRTSKLLLVPFHALCPFYHCFSCTKCGSGLFSFVLFTLYVLNVPYF